MISVEVMIAGMRFVAALGCGLIAGVFFAFSTFVMKGLSRLPAEKGVAAMRSINVTAVNSWFLAAFLGTSAACGIVVVTAFWRWNVPSSLLALAGGMVFLIGSLLVTAIFNVPMNSALDSLSATDPDQTARWIRYVTHWTMWNHVRTITSLAGAILLIVGWHDERKHHSLAHPTMDQKADADRVIEDPASPKLK